MPKSIIITTNPLKNFKKQTFKYFPMAESSKSVFAAAGELVKSDNEQFYAFIFPIDQWSEEEAKAYVRARNHSIEKISHIDEANFDQWKEVELNVVKSDKKKPEGYIGTEGNPFLFHHLKEVKKDDDSKEGTFDAYASIFNNIDFGLDVIEPGAYKRTLKEDTKIRGVFYAHDTDLANLMGGANLKEDDKGLAVKGFLYLKDPMVIKAWDMMKSKVIDRMSIGYRAIKATWIEKVIEGIKRPIRKIQEIRLYEVSILPVGMAMNNRALITGVKNINDVIEYIRYKADEDEMFRNKILSILNEPLTKTSILDTLVNTPGKIESNVNDINLSNLKIASWNYEN